jgi:CheY-like chemotaxis protein/chromosome segregation ATPase
MDRDLLLIDPDPELAEAVRRAFAPAGFQVTTLAAGEAAVDRCRATRPDLILLTAELPDMSGFSVCNRIKRLLASVPLILCTTEATEAAIEAHRQTKTRADDYVRKPYDVADLLQRASALVQDAPLASTLPPPPRAAAAPPPIPGAHAPPPRPRPPAQNGAAAVAAQAPGDLFEAWPRDPSPPKGSPEEKLEFFRERLRAKDAFLARVKEAVAALRQDASELRGELEVAWRDLAEGERARAALEKALAEARDAGTAAAAQGAELARQLAESEATRQSLSDVLSEAMQASEAAEQDFAQRLAAADDARNALEATLAGERRAGAEALQAERDARSQAEAERAAEREALEAQLAALRDERDGLAADVSRRDAQLEHQAAQAADERAAAASALLAEREEKDTARARAEKLAGELAEAHGACDSLGADLVRERGAKEALARDLEASRGEAAAYAEKAAALEQAYAAVDAERAAAAQQCEDLARALDEGRVSAEGEVARLQGQLGEGARREAQRTAERDELARRLGDELKALEAVRGRAATLDAEVARLAALEPLAAEAPRLRRDLAHAHELLQQRTQQAEAAARAAHQATADRERVKEQAALELEARGSEIARLGAQLMAAERRAAELEGERTAREAEARRAVAEAEARRKAQADEAAEHEKKLVAEAQRIKAALVELERRLEASARAEGASRRRIAELEKERAELAGFADRVGHAEEVAARAREELEDLRSENDFLNGEVARYHQKNKDLLAQVKKA